MKKIIGIGITILLMLITLSSMSVLGINSNQNTCDKGLAEVSGVVKNKYGFGHPATIIVRRGTNIEDSEYVGCDPTNPIGGFRFEIFAEDEGTSFIFYATVFSITGHYDNSELTIITIYPGYNYEFELVLPNTPRIKQKTMSNENNEGKALFASMYLELDPNSDQVQVILDNYNSPPQGFLTNIDIVVPDPNDEDGEWFMIAPLIRTLIGDWIGIGPFFEIIEPTETTTVHIKILWGDVHYWPPGEETPEEFIIDGWSPLLSWEY